MPIDDLLALDQEAPSDWGAQKDYDSWPRDDTSQVFIHWGGTPVSDACAAGDREAERDTLRAYERYHLSKKWKGIAYDWAIGNSGTLYRCRGDARSAATSGDIDLDHISNNDEAEAVVFLIGSGQKPSRRALQTLEDVLSALDYTEVYGHQESAKQGSGTSTSCPGDDLMDAVVLYRKTGRTVDAESTGGGTSTPDTSSPAPRPTPSPSAGSGGKTGFEKMRLLKLKSPMMRGQDVKAVQVLLENLHGIDVGTIDGWYGPKSVAGVKKFQRRYKLGVDGIVGPNTRRELNGG